LRGSFASARPRHSYFPKDTRHFQIGEWLCLGADSKPRRIFSCVLQEQKARILRASLGITSCKSQFINNLILYGGASRERTILHRRIPSTNQIWVQSPSPVIRINVSLSALAI
jgi:hypothetical protein